MNTQKQAYIILVFGHYKTGYCGQDDKYQNAHNMTLVIQDHKYWLNKVDTLYLLDGLVYYNKKEVALVISSDHRPYIL